MQHCLRYAHASCGKKHDIRKLITTRLRSFLLAIFPPVFQFLISISDILKFSHELLDVIKALVQHLLTTQFEHLNISCVLLSRCCWFYSTNLMDNNNLSSTERVCDCQLEWWHVGCCASNNSSLATRRCFWHATLRLRSAICWHHHP